jgi:hypothetical protein
MEPVRASSFIRPGIRMGRLRQAGGGRRRAVGGSKLGGRPITGTQYLEVSHWSTGMGGNGGGLLRQSQKRCRRPGRESWGRPGSQRTWQFEIPGRVNHGERRSRSDGGLVESGNVGFGVGGVDGVWHSGGIRDSTRGICADAPAGTAGGREGAGGSGAGVDRGQRSEVRDQQVSGNLPGRAESRRGIDCGRTGNGYRYLF